MKLIEFFILNDSKNLDPHGLLIDAFDISFIKYESPYVQKMVTKNGQSFFVFGTNRVVNNRLHYIVYKNKRFIDDSNLRPTDLARFNPKGLDIDLIMTDEALVISSLISSNKIENYKNLTVSTKEMVLDFLQNITTYFNVISPEVIALKNKMENNL